MLKGKALMLGVEVEGIFHTVAYASSHKLDVSAQTGEVSSKDHNDKSVAIEVTGIGWSVTTDNMVEDNSAIVACGYKTLKSLILSGLPLKIQVRYFEESIGKDSLGQNNDWYKWEPDAQAVISGDAIVTALTLNAPNKQNATYSATFTGKGEYDVGQ